MARYTRIRLRPGLCLIKALGCIRVVRGSWAVRA